MSKHSIILLAGGNGSRMNSDIPKQYLELKGKPILLYSLLLFEQSFFNEIILVVRKGEEEYCKKEYVEKYHLNKVSAITAGGKERYLSVYAGIEKIKETDYIWIHDGARPFLTNELLKSLKETVEKTKAAILGVHVKDTIKQTDRENTVITTIPRENLWNIQTPQAFSANLLKTAYQKLMKKNISGITDDGMVVETMTNHKITIVEGSYHNIKITTPEDMQLANLILSNNSDL